MEFLPPPKLGGNNDTESLKELQGYLFRIIEQLNFIFNDIDLKIKKIEERNSGNV